LATQAIAENGSLPENILTEKYVESINNLLKFYFHDKEIILISILAPISHIPGRYIT
jgi:hypothetical protein